MGQPVKEEFAHSIPVPPQVLDKSWEELSTYQLETWNYDVYVLTLALSHFSLQLHLHQVNPYALDNRANIRQVLIRLAVFYFLLYLLTYMEEWGRLTNVPLQYVFIWEKSEHFNQTGETLNMALSQDS
jgi:hypothetical protein